MFACLFAFHYTGEGVQSPRHTLTVRALTFPACFIFILRTRCSVCCSGLPWAHSVAQATFELVMLFVSIPCIDWIMGLHHQSQIFFIPFCETKISLFSPGWPRPCNDPPPSTWWVLELQEYTTTPTSSYFLWLASLSSPSIRARTLVGKVFFFFSLHDTWHSHYRNWILDRVVVSGPFAFVSPAVSCSEKNYWVSGILSKLWPRFGLPAWRVEGRQSVSHFLISVTWNLS